MDVARAVLGLAVCVALLVLMSENRRRIGVRVVVVAGTLLPLMLDVLLLRGPGTSDVFGAMASSFNGVINRGDVG